MTRTARALLLAAACLAAAGAAQAQAVSLAGMLGAKALLIVDGGAPSGVAAGETFKGVKVVSTGGDQAVVEIGGKRYTLHVGDSPASVGGKGGAPRGDRIVLNASSGDHYTAQGTINGRSAQFLVDTGATFVAMGVAEAERLGLSYKAGQAVRTSTANGVAQGWLVKLASVRIGDVEVYDVDCIVNPQAMPFVLLGNSFLTRFRMRRDSDQMVLERRY